MMNQRKTTCSHLIAGLLALILTLLVAGCTDKGADLLAEESQPLPEQLLGTWYSYAPENGYYMIEFASDAIRFTLAAGTSHSRTEEWTDYRIEDGNILSVYRFDAHYQQDAHFRHPFALTEDGRLWINHLAPSIAAVIGQYPGDRRRDGEIWFGREINPDFPKNEEVKARLLGAWISTTPAEGYFKIVFDEDEIYYTAEIGTAAETTQRWEDYRIEGGRTLLVNRNVNETTDTSFLFRHTFIFQEDGSLRIVNIQKNDAPVAPGAGDVSVGFHDVVFRRAED